MTKYNLYFLHGIAKSTYYKLKSKHEGMSVSDIKHLKASEEENRQLKQMYIDLSVHPYSDDCTLLAPVNNDNNHYGEPASPHTVIARDRSSVTSE